jgi:hypothetical protein
LWKIDLRGGAARREPDVDAREVRARPRVSIVAPRRGGSGRT